MVDEQLDLTPRKEVFVSVHGYNNTFDDAVATVANLWHFTGRQGLPVAYSWPAASGGLTGYNTDSESGEFTIFHLKMFLEDLAHSRGTDDPAAAIRELGISARAAGKDPKVAPKLGDVVLASRRISSELLPEMMKRLTLCRSPEDKALIVSRGPHQSVSRLGLLNLNTFTPEQLQPLAPSLWRLKEDSPAPPKSLIEHVADSVLPTSPF